MNEIIKILIERDGLVKKDAILSGTKPEIEHTIEYK